MITLASDQYYPAPPDRSVRRRNRTGSLRILRLGRRAPCSGSVVLVDRPVRCEHDNEGACAPHHEYGLKVRAATMTGYKGRS